jgi:hypothetical protein
MALYLVIDTTNWKQLVSPHAIDPHLKSLRFLVQSGQAFLLVPESIEEEWNVHRETEIIKLRKKLNDDLSRMRLWSVQPEGVAEKQESAFRLLESQVSMIDEMFSKAILVKDTDASNRQVIYHQKTAKLDKSKRLPPFHNKTDSFNDARTIFSVLEYLKENAIAEANFISDNPNEFASPLDLDNALHPYYVSLYPEITLHYGRKVGALLDELSAKGYTFKAPDRAPKPVAKNSIILDHTQSIGEQLYQYLEKRFKEFHILPKRLFTKNDPIVISSQPPPDEVYTLATDNPAVYEYLYPALDLSNLTADEIARRKAVIKKLVHNHLFLIKMQGAPEAQLDYEEERKVCACPVCIYKRLDFSALFQFTEDPPASENPAELSRIAFGHYLAGKIKNSIKAYQQLYGSEQAKSSQLTYLSRYNTKVLGRILDFYGDSEEDTRSLAAQAMQIDLDHEYHLQTNAIDQPVLDWLHTSTFYEETLSEIVSMTSSIRGYYHSKSNGHHAETRELIETFEVFSQFLLQNGVINSLNYSTDRLADAYIEGIFASLACQQGMSGRLQLLDDSMLSTIQLNIHPEIIRKFSNRYKVRAIQGSPEIKAFHESWKRLFAQLPEMNTRYVSDGNGKFWDRYGHIALTTITIFSLLKVEDELVNEFADALIPFLREQKMIKYFHAEKALEFFIDKKKKQLTASTLESFLDLWITDEKYRMISSLDLITDTLESRGKKIVLTDAQFNTLVSFALAGKEKYNENVRWSALCVLYSHLEVSENKNSILAYINNRLSASFDADEYQEATMLTAIEPTDQLNNEYFVAIRQILAKGKREAILWHEEFYHDYRIDAFINFCFKYNLQIPEDIRSAIVALDKYYEWLLNMEDFDYAQYNPVWLKNSFTFYFKNAYRKSARLKDFLMTYIRENFDDADTQRIFMYTYGFDD